MFNFGIRSPAATTVAPTTINSTFTVNPSTISQPWNPFGISSTAQPSIFGTGVQNTSTIRPLGNPPSSTTPANFTPANSIGTSIFGTNQAAPAAQPTNVFGSNLPGTTVKFGPVSAQAPFSTASTTTNIVGSNNTMTTTANPFGSTNSTMSNTSGSLFNQPLPTAPAASTTPFTFGATVAPTTNIFGLPPSTITNPFNTTTSTAPVTTSIFGPTTTTNPFSVKSSTTQPPFNFFTNTNTSKSSIFGPQPVATTSIFPQPTTATPFSNTTSNTITNPFGISMPSTTSATTITPAFPALNPMTSTSGASNIFGVSGTSAATTAPIFNNLITQPTLPTTTSFSFASSATSILNTSASTTTNTSAFNPSLFSYSTAAPIQPAVTSSSSTILSQPPKQEQNTQQSGSIIQQQFLALSLLDPYANRGKKDFTNIDQIQIPKESAIVSTLSTTTNTTTITTSTPIPITLPIQSNFGKVSSSRSLVDVNFKLKPVSSSPTLNDDIKPSNQQSMVSTGPVKSTLAGNFTDEEELVLLGRTKMSKLRLSNDIIDRSSKSDSIRSLYPVRCLAELEKLTNITPPSSLSSSPTTTTVNNERPSRQSNENRDASPNHHSTSSISSHQSSSSSSSSPIIQRKSNTNPQIDRLPILTRNNYYMKPTLSELKSLFNDKGQCILKQFTVGHEIYGSVTFYGQIDVAGLNLDEIIQINRHEVTVYPDDNNKPTVGKELNLPARITLLGVYPIDRTTGEEITDIERIKAVNYNEHLREITKKFDGEFINYEITDGAWTFMVKHFTRYGLDENQDDFIVQS